MKFSRVWAMPNKYTFTIKPIKELIQRYIKKLPEEKRILDPFLGKSPFKEFCITNDLDAKMGASKNLDALDFLKEQGNLSAEMVLFDPPYSPRQVSECYKKHKMAVNMQTTQASFWSNMKAEIGRVVKPNGYTISCGWNSGGIGKKYDFEIVEVLMVPHGGYHNDTLVVVERKI